MSRPSVYNLTAIGVGETKFFPCGPHDCAKIKKAAHNHNRRSDVYFTTRYHDGVLYVTRIK